MFTCPLEKEEKLDNKNSYQKIKHANKNTTWHNVYYALFW